MEINISQQGALQVVAISGEVDLSTSPKVREALLSCIKGAHGVVVDLSAVSYIDSSGVASLVEAFQTAKTKGLGFALAEVSETPMRVLKLARLDQVFVIYPRVDEAVAAMA
ncbi:STAS domain-containing protein [Magnetovibrio blakemorei]|uniref:Anti-sigma factor antagonist n=1 Tax=Magnetovibrio blakemorei TaxID=28181 RepID=A0A1E5Q7P2_9PROT|nr:STAS domain-containing protein [Magnetovibrio blakemorei]OEJ67153.1 anti-anti-sigma factor [Magnetovibrio blakemorei]